MECYGGWNSSKNQNTRIANSWMDDNSRLIVDET
jgi:hypothetical protein